VALSRRIDGHWRLVGYGDVRRGTPVALQLPEGYQAVVEAAATAAASTATTTPVPDVGNTDAEHTDAPTSVGANERVPTESTRHAEAVPAGAVAPSAVVVAAGASPAQPTLEVDWDYSRLLQRMRSAVEAKHKRLVKRNRIKIPPPELLRCVHPCVVWCSCLQLLASHG